VEEIVAEEQIAAVVVGAVALVGVGAIPPEQIQEDKAPPNQGVRSVTNLTILLLSVGIGLKKNFSPTATRVQGSWRQDMALIQIGMLTVEPLIISLASLTSSP
jgi:hypothetical protein